MSVEPQVRDSQIQKAIALSRQQVVPPQAECICEVTQILHEDLSWSRSMVRVPDPHCEVHPAG